MNLISTAIKHIAAALALLATAMLVSAQTTSLPDLDVPFVTTPDKVVDAMLALAAVTARDFVLDLGSGDGRIVITAVLKNGARGFGVEIDPALVKQSEENALKAGVADRARFAVQDLFATDLGQASVTTMYLLPDVNLKLRPELLKLKPGTRIVSHDWECIAELRERHGLPKTTILVQSASIAATATQFFVVDVAVDASS